MQILEIRLLTNSLKKQIEFYSNVLGLNTSYLNDGAGAIDIGSSKLIFDEVTSINNPYYHFAVNIPENQINEAIGWLKAKADLLEYENSPLVNFPNWNAHSVYFYDAGGNIVELIARHSLDNKTDSEFSSASFLNISEIGMPAENVKNFCGEINQKLNENLWWGNTETFAAVGDENGLFIVVTGQRNWFPTNKPSKIFPLAVTIENNSTASLEYSPYKIATKSSELKI